VQVLAELFSRNRSTAKADIAIVTDQHQATIGKTIAVCKRAVWIIEALSYPLSLAPGGALHDMIDIQPRHIALDPALIHEEVIEPAWFRSAHSDRTTIGIDGASNLF
jgi:hypothetical protein